ncbi:MAG: PaaI family thioesterase, partial [Kiloniellales bacterium]
MAQISIEEFHQLSRRSLPLAQMFGFRVERLEPGSVTARMPFDDNHLRPGGTIAGPSIMALADYAMYAVVMSLIGRAEPAVTTNLSCNFLRRPGPADLIAEARILKLGRRLAVGEVTLYSEGGDEPVAHVTATYSIPSEGKGEGNAE